MSSCINTKLSLYKFCSTTSHIIMSYKKYIFNIFKIPNILICVCVYPMTPKYDDKV